MKYPLLVNIYFIRENCKLFIFLYLGYHKQRDGRAIKKSRGMTFWLALLSNCLEIWRLYSANSLL